MALPMVVDLHCHYPMHIFAGDPESKRKSNTVALMTDRDAGDLVERFERAVLHVACKLANYQGPGNSPAVTSDTLMASRVRVALSMLYSPFDELAFGGAPPKPAYFDDLTKQISQIENHVRDLELAGNLITIVHHPADLQSALDAGKVALIHAVEGGFHLGDASTVAANAATLGDAGVAYITVAHLLYRAVATNAPALPFFSDAVYHALLPQPEIGLTDLGNALIAAMYANGILVDLTHMSRLSITDTLDLLDQLDPGQGYPVLATHSACDAVSPAEYNLTDDHIRRIAKRGGVIGLIVSEHLMCSGMKKPRSFDESMAVVFKHIEHINDVTRDIVGWEPYRFIGFGSDQDGFIKPAMPGLEGPSGFKNVIAALKAKYQDDTIVDRICSGNSLTALQLGWRVQHSIPPI